MDWQEKEQEDEFEAFLRQFQPARPKALPNHRPIGLALAAAAVLLLAIVILCDSGRWETRARRMESTSQVKATYGLTTAPVSTTAGAPARVNAGVASQRLRVGGAIKPPVRLVNVNPVYPEDARAAGIEGLVVLEIVIGKTGAVIETQVLRSIPELDQAAIDAVRQWQYQPTLLNGEPVEIEMAVTINFTLS